LTQFLGALGPISIDVPMPRKVIPSGLAWLRAGT
jgi:hypothetical protein